MSTLDGKLTSVVKDIRLLSSILGGYAIGIGAVAIMIGMFAGIPVVVGGVLHLLIGTMLLCERTFLQKYPCYKNS